MKRYQLSVAIGLVLAFARPVVAQNTTFSMVRSSGAVAAGCILNAKGRVTINSLGPVEVMHVEVSGLPANTEFDLFVIQLPNAPFGLSWYQGDIDTDSNGRGVGDFIGRFSKETFIVAPAVQHLSCTIRLRSPMQTPIQRHLRSIRSTWGYGSVRQRPQRRQAVRAL